MKLHQPKVILFAHTENPLKAIALAVSSWTSDNFPESQNEISEDDSEILAKKAIKAFHKTALEYANFTFIIKNCSRAFQQQLTRTRHASFSIQSMRVVTKNDFAYNGNYTMPPGLSFMEKEVFHDNMVLIQHQYREMIKDGASAEDARSILPLCIHSDISMTINIASIYNMLRQRLCVNTQLEYRQVALQMKERLNEVSSILSDPIDAPCVKIKKCPMVGEYCGIKVWEEDNRNDIYENFISHSGKGKTHQIIWKENR